MANANQDVDPVALPIVPCPNCGRNAVTCVARRGQNAGRERGSHECRDKSGMCMLHAIEQYDGDKMMWPQDVPTSNYGDLLTDLLDRKNIMYEDQGTRMLFAKPVAFVLNIDKKH